MSKQPTSRRRARRRRTQLSNNRSSNSGDDPREDRAADAITIAWTVSVTMVFLADVVTVAAHFYAWRRPDAKSAASLEAIMLLMASVLGAVSLVLLPVVWRVRRLKPPRGYVVFAVLVAAAPIVTLLGKLWL